MKHLVIIGAGGMGRSIYCIAKGCIGYNTDFDIKGFIDDDISSLDSFNNYPPVLSSIKDYKIKEDDVFTCSIGDVETKINICRQLINRGATFYTLIHKNSLLHQNVSIGEGCIIAEYAVIGADASIEKNSIIQSFAIVGHDCKIGSYVRIDTHATCVGGVVVKDFATVHTGAILNHKVVVEEYARVGAGSFVIKKVKYGTTVHGNPANSI